MPSIVLIRQARGLFDVLSFPSFRALAREEGFMSQPESGQQVTVTAAERAHPAVRKLARAAILLARQQLSDKQDMAAANSTSKPGAQRAPEEENGQEVNHD
jgi:hypothetical protein